MNNWRYSVIAVITLTLATLKLSCGTGLDYSGPGFSCSDAIGTMEITKLLCSNVDSTEGNIFLQFNEDESVSLSSGPDDCYEESYGTYITEPFTYIFLEGNSQCFTNGTPVASCTSGSRNCTVSNKNGVVLAFETCEFDGTTMTLTRTITSLDVANEASGCDEGDFEVLELQFI